MIWLSKKKAELKLSEAVMSLDDARKHLEKAHKPMGARRAAILQEATYDLLQDVVNSA